MLPERSSPPLPIRPSPPELRARPDELEIKAQLAVRTLEKRITACQEAIATIRQQERARKFAGQGIEPKIPTASELLREFNKFF
jgi:hypothetical protein